MMRYWKAVTGLLVLWLFVIIYMSNSFPSGGDGSQTERQLERAMEELQKLRLQNKELHSLAQEIKSIRLNMVSGNVGTVDVDKMQKRLDHANKELKKLAAKGSKLNFLGDGLSQDETANIPSKEHEHARRKVEDDVREFWFYIRSELNKLKDGAGNGDLVKQINSVLAESTGHQNSLRNDLDTLTNTVDSQEDWRLQESKSLGNIVQRRLKYLQNPKDCSLAKKMVCNLSKGCGYGCQLHHVTYCMMMAYGTGRTLILESKGWRYASGGWETVFLPLSDTCTNKHGASSKHWGPEDAIKDVQVVEMPIVDSLHPRPSYLPLSIPEDLGERLERLHGDPAVWWIGQIVTYLTRPQPHLRADMETTREKLGFNNPIVGVHIRRTDKVGLEAAFHGVDEYMKHVNEWFDVYEYKHPGIQRKVYLATDDASVLSEAKKNYPHYVFISDNEISKSAGVARRYTDSSLRGVIIDIHLLSLCDYLVCTFSSQVCRVAYELMQPMRGDASQWFKSLDDVYYFGGQNAHNMQVLENHVPNRMNEIELERGDLVGIAGNHWNGFSKGKNTRTGKSGLYPSYKVQNKIQRVRLPTYHQAGLR